MDFHGGGLIVENPDPAMKIGQPDAAVFPGILLQVKVSV